ncbi:ester cyclase [Nocardia arthritidis]|uniref:Ester cyclase n=1 Tax=Nocardia arthritidis TaxID=228602 RepID=A0A6G9Y482_9NOCA|nr:ester cyclase [Nocardia arthritidis]QIS07954.1 hypothetical protein F5544_00090 [Nocardia arthritidis]
MTYTAQDLRSTATRAIQLMASGSEDEFAAVIHPDAINRESKAEPAACRGRGPSACYASALWLRSAFSDMRWDIHEVVVERDLVVLHTTAYGTHTGTFVVYDADARPAQAFPATGRSFAVTQTHWCRMADGLLIEHWANRDDIGQSTQLGWVPPTPVYIARMRLALRRARRNEK